MKITGHLRQSPKAMMIDIAVIILFTSLLQIFFTSVMGIGGRSIFLGDTDTLMHYLKLFDRDFITDNIYYRDNAPYGLELHWTLAYDLLISGFYDLLRIVVNEQDAKYISVAYSSFLFYLLSAIFIYWAPKPVLDRQSRFNAAILFGLLMPIYAYGIIGRGDHHTLLLFFTILTMGFAIRFAYDNSIIGGALLGAFTVFSVWVSPETSIAMSLIYAGLILSYVCNKEMRNDGASGLGLIGGTAIFSIWALGIDMPTGGFFEPHVDRYSILWVIFCNCLAVGAVLSSMVLGLHKFSTGPFLKKMVIAVLPSFILALIWVTAFPTILNGPLGYLPDHLKENWLYQIAEMRTADTLELGAMFILTPLLGIVGAGFLAISHKGNRRVVWLSLMVALIILTIPAIMQVRFSYYPQGLGAIILGHLAIKISLKDMVGLDYSKIAIRGMSFGVLVFAITPIFASTFGRSIGAGSTVQYEEAFPCDAGQIKDLLAPYNESHLHQIIFSDINYAPRILFETNLRTVAGPYQRNVQGLDDIIRWSTTRDKDEFDALMTDRGAGFALLCQSTLSPQTDRTNLSVYQLLGRGVESKYYSLSTKIEDPSQGGWRLFIRSQNEEPNEPDDRLPNEGAGLSKL